MYNFTLTISKNPVFYNCGGKFKNYGYFKEDEEKLSFNINTDIELYKLYIRKIYFKDFGNICLLHLPQYEKIGDTWIREKNLCECEDKFDLLQKRDVHLRLGKDIEKKAIRAIAYLKGRGYFYSDKRKDDLTISSIDNFMKYPANRLYIFGSIINDLRILGGLYKDHIFGLFKSSNLFPHIQYFYIGDQNKRINILPDIYTCSYCHKKGHLDSFCWEKERERKKFIEHK